jgi:hypothetical protein
MNRENFFIKLPREPVYNFEVDEDGYVLFWDVANRFFKEQIPDAVRFLKGYGDKPNLGEDLRIKIDSLKTLHDIRIHKDDIGEFLKRYQEYAETRGKNATANKIH